MAWQSPTSVPVITWLWGRHTRSSSGIQSLFTSCSFLLILSAFCIYFVFLGIKDDFFLCTLGSLEWSQLGVPLEILTPVFYKRLTSVKIENVLLTLRTCWKCFLPPCSLPRTRNIRATFFYCCTSTVILLLLFYYCTSTMVWPCRSVNNTSGSHWDDLMKTIVQHHRFRWYHPNPSSASPLGNLGASPKFGKFCDVKVISWQLPLRGNLLLGSN